MSDTWQQLDTSIFDSDIYAPTGPTGDAGIKLKGDVKELTERTKNLRADNGTATAPSISFRSDSDTGIYRVGANTLGLATNATLRAQVDSGGVACVAATQYSGFKIFTGANIVAEVIGMSATNDGGTLHLYSGGVSNLNVRISADPGLHSFLLLPSSRSLGLGTSNPQRRVHVVGTDGAVGSFPTNAVDSKDFVVIENSGNANLCFIANTSSSSTIRFVESGAAVGTGGSISYDHASDFMKFSVNSAERARITSSGIFAVATTSPLVDTNVPVQINAPSSGSGEAWYGANRDGSHGLLVGYKYGTGAVIRQVHSTEPLQFWTNSTSMAMEIDSSQKVGIGTSPLHLVHIKESVNSALEYQLLLQNQGALSHAAGIAMQVTSSGETTGKRPKAAIILERNSAGGTGHLNFYHDTSNDSDAFAATDKVMYLSVGGGLIICGASGVDPTGGARGVGTINAKGVYDDGTLLTDYVFDIAFGGGRDLLTEIESRIVDETVTTNEGQRIQQKKQKRFWKGSDVEVNEDDFEAYSKLPKTIKTIDEMEAFVREHHHLPAIDGRNVWKTQGKPSVGKLMSQLYETIEHLSLYIIDLNGRLKALEQNSREQ